MIARDAVLLSDEQKCSFFIFVPKKHGIQSILSALNRFLSNLGELPSRRMEFPHLLLRFCMERLRACKGTKLIYCCWATETVGVE